MKGQSEGQASAVALCEEFPLDPTDYVFHELAEVHERWANRLRYDNFAISKSYLNLKANILVDCVAKGRDGRGKKCRAIFKGVKLTHRIEPDEGRLYWFACFGMGRDQSDSNGTPAGPCGEEQPVSIANAKAMQLPECVVPSLIGFQCLDEGDGLGGEFLYLVFGKGFEFFSVSSDWERNVIDVDGRVMLHGKAAGGVVKGSSQILDGISYDGRKVWRDGFMDAELVDQLAGLLVFIDEAGVGVGIPERLCGRVDLLDVAFGPFNL